CSEPATSALSRSTLGADPQLGRGGLVADDKDSDNQVWLRGSGPIKNRRRLSVAVGSVLSRGTPENQGLARRPPLKNRPVLTSTISSLRNSMALSRSRNDQKTGKPRIVPLHDEWPLSAQPSPSPWDPPRSAIHTRSSHSTCGRTVCYGS